MSAGGSREQVARLLTLVPYLHRRGTVRVDEAAEALGVTPEQVTRDLKVLLMCGLPGGYPDDLIDVDLDAIEDPDGDRVIRVSNADYLDRPVRLTVTEATAMMVALLALRSGSSDETRDIVDRALTKLQDATAGTPGFIDPGTDDESDQARLRTDLERAVRQGRQVELSYWVPSRDEQTHRVVDPRGLATVQGATYLDAWCHSAEADRLFRLDRILSAEVLDTPVSRPADSARDLSDGLFVAAEEAVRVTLRLAPPARWVVEYYTVEETRALPDGALEVELLVADERWLRRLLLRLAPWAEVVAPPGYAETFAAAAREALNLYGPSA